MTNKNDIIYTFENGATLIYSKQNASDTTSMVIGFPTGSRLDGEHTGIAHFVEHILFHGDEGEIETANKLKILDAKINGFTSQTEMALNFNCPNYNLESVCGIFSKLLTKRNYTEKELRDEKRVVLQEKAFSDDGELSSFDKFINDLLTEKMHDSQTILGKKVTLDKIDKNVVNQYMDRYLTKENLVISVVTNHDFDTIKNLVEKNFVSVLPSNPNEKIKIERIKLKDVDCALYGKHYPNYKNAVVEILFKPEKINSKFFRFEDVLFNYLGGLLMAELRQKNPLVYSAEYLPYYNYAGLYTCKMFSFVTAPENVDKCLEKIFDITYNLRENGITKKQYNDYIQFLNSNKKRNYKYFSKSASSLFHKYCAGRKVFHTPVSEYMTYEEANQYMKDLFKDGKLNVVAEGNLDKLYPVKKIYNDFFNVPTLHYALIYDLLENTDSEEELKQELIGLGIPEYNVDKVIKDLNEIKITDLEKEEIAEIDYAKHIANEFNRLVKEGLIRLNKQVQEEEENVK